MKQHFTDNSENINSDSSSDSDDDYSEKKIKFLKELNNYKPSKNKKIKGKQYMVSFRGVTYMKSYYNQQDRRNHRRTSQVGKQVYSSAVHDNAKVNFTAFDNKDDKKLQESANKLNKHMQQLGIASSGTAYWDKTKTSRKFSRLLFMAYQRYVNSYKEFRQEGAKHYESGKNVSYELKNAPQKIFALSSKSNFISTTNKSKHAEEYAYTLKLPTVGTGLNTRSEALRPNFRKKGAKKGKPKHPYLGKIYVIFSDVQSIKSKGVLYSKQLHAKEEVNIKYRILFEEEATYLTDIPGAYVIHEVKARVPSLEEYKIFFKDKYGLTENKFNKFKQNILNTKNDINQQVGAEEKLYKYLIKHQCKQLENFARKKAEELGGVLVSPDANDSQYVNDLLKNFTEKKAEELDELLVSSNINDNKYLSTFSGKKTQFNKDVAEDLTTDKPLEIKFNEKGVTALDNRVNNALSNEHFAGNCFDIAVGLGSIGQRQQLVNFALQNSNNQEFRNLIAPEIRHAMALTAIYMNSAAVATEDTENKVIELFAIANVLIDAEDKQQVVEQIKFLINTSNKDNSELSGMILPEEMRTKEVQNLFNEYEKAHETMREIVSECNDVLGFKDGKRKPIEWLDNFFKKQENQQQYKDTYEKYKKSRDEILTPHEKALNDYCSRKDVYETYVKEYYGNQEWFAFQRSAAEENSTSMVDVVARFLSAVIVIYDVSEKEIYRTKNNETTEISVKYNGINHFTTCNKISGKKNQPPNKNSTALNKKVYVYSNPLLKSSPALFSKISVDKTDIKILFESKKI